MKAVFLVKNGAANDAFEIREAEKPKAGAEEVLIKVEGFGLNFADVMARLGLYKDCPPLPAILGYDIVGRVEETGENVTNLKVGDRVTAMTRFGGYAEYAITDARAAAKIPEQMDVSVAGALTTQYCTAYYCAEEMVRLHEGDRVLVHSAAGGVGTALVQLAKRKKCIIYGTVGSDEKVSFLKEQGVDFPINYRKHDFAKEIKKISNGERLDVVFDAVGGDYVKKGFKLLGAGGRLVLYGAAQMAGKNILGKIKVGLGFGLYHPAPLMMKSKSILGVYLLQIGDYRPAMLKRCLENVVQLTEAGELSPGIGKKFPFEKVGEAHAHLESRQSIGKIVVTI